MTSFMDFAPPEARDRRRNEVRARRNAEAACALDFLVYGDGDADDPRPHAERCVHGADDPCSRNYDPYPTREAEPEGRMYENTGIGALYGLPGCEGLMWQLAGWNLVPRSTR